MVGAPGAGGRNQLWALALPLYDYNVLLQVPKWLSQALKTGDYCLWSSSRPGTCSGGALGCSAAQLSAARIKASRVAVIYTVLSFYLSEFDVMDIASPCCQKEASTSGPPLQQKMGGKVHDQRDDKEIS